jgi:hypothetical protein
MGDYSIETRTVRPGVFYAVVSFYYPMPGRYVRRHTTEDATDRHTAYQLAEQWIAHFGNTACV